MTTDQIKKMYTNEKRRMKTKAKAQRGAAVCHASMMVCFARASGWMSPRSFLRCGVVKKSTEIGVYVDGSCLDGVVFIQIMCK